VTRFFIDPHGELPAYAQLKNQIKFGRMNRELAPGDVLPSIRALALQVGVGVGVVRRAYRELSEMGLLRADRRKHVVARAALRTASGEETMAPAAVEECDRLIGWAGETRVSAIALGRLLLMRALAQEAVASSYVFVDVSREAAEESAGRIARAWGVKVAGVSMDDFANLSSADVRRLSAVLTNEHLYEEMTKVVAEGTPGVFAVRMRLDKRLQERIRKLRARSRVLVVVSNKDLPATGNALFRECERLFGTKQFFQIEADCEVPDLAAYVKARRQRYQLILLFPHVWERTPAKIRRITRAVRVVVEPDLQSLEEVRVAAGVLV
jgi:DNA-binding transcriptional regulator YhcF (GntR family)/vacuolar-type H+-ATPase subunit F/Vma7